MDIKPNNNSLKSSTISFEELKGIVESEFTVEEALMEYEIPTFYIKTNPLSNKAFLRLVDHLDSFKLIPAMKDRDGKIVLQTFSNIKCF